MEGPGAAAQAAAADVDGFEQLVLITADQRHWAPELVNYNARMRRRFRSMQSDLRELTTGAGFTNAILEAAVVDAVNVQRVMNNLAAVPAGQPLPALDAEGWLDVVRMAEITTRLSFLQPNQPAALSSPRIGGLDRLYRGPPDSGATWRFAAWAVLLGVQGDYQAVRAGAHNT